jgi:hypothetical protein
MEKQKKQVVSMRLNAADLERVKEIARLLKVRESDVYRFAIKTTLTKLAPIYDAEMRGRDLLPAFIEMCAELTNHFELDADSLDRLINGDLTDQRQRVEKDDIRLLAMLGMPEQYLLIKLRELVHKPAEHMGMSALIRRYFYDKYSRAEPALEAGNQPEAASTQ